MKRLTIFITSLFLFVCLPIIAMAAAGDIQVTFTGELEGTVSDALDGASIELKCDTTDNGFGSSPDTSYYEDDADNDETVTFASASLSMCPNGYDMKVIVTKDGYVTKESAVVARDQSQNPQTISVTNIRYNMKINVTDELGNSVTGASFDFENGEAWAVAGADGAANDEDTSANGAIYVAVPIDFASAAFNAAAPHDLVVSKTGYIKQSYSAVVSSGSQAVFNAQLEYPFVLIAQDELGNVIDLDLAENTYGHTVTPGAGMYVDHKYGNYGAYTSSEAMYLAADTGGAVNITLAVSGYIAGTTNGYSGTYTYVNTGPQQVIYFNNTNGSKLSYQVKVDAASVGLSDENSEALALSSSDIWEICVDPGCSSTMTVLDIPVNAHGMTEDSNGNNTYWDGTDWYMLPSNTGVDTAYMKIRKNGYIDTTEQGGEAINAAAGSAQATPDFSDGGAGEMMDRSLRISSVENEIDATVTQLVTDSVTIHTSSDCSVASDVTATRATNRDLSATPDWLLNLDQDNGPYYIKYDHTNYLSTCHATAIFSTSSDANYTTQTTLAFTYDNSNPVLFPIKVLVYNELGNEVDVSDDSGDTDFDNDELMVGTTAGQFATDTGSNALYFAASASGALDDGEDNGSQAVAAYTLNTIQGFLQIDTTVDTALATVNPGTDALGQTIVTLSGTTPCGAGSIAAGDQTTTCRGLQYTTKFTLKDELGTAIPTSSIALTDILVDGNNAATSSANVLYYQAVTGAALDVTDGGPDGFVQFDSAATDIDLDAGGANLNGVTPGTTAVTHVTFSGTTPCNTDAAIADGSSVTCNGFDYTLKLTGGGADVDDELGNNLTLVGAGKETVAVYTAGGCNTPATMIAGPTFDTDTWYMAVANGSSYRVKLQKSGYISNCDDGDTAVTAAAVQRPTFDDAPGSPLVYNLKVTDANVDDVIGSGTPALDGSIGEDFAIYTDSNCTLEATYETNGATADDAIFDTDTWYIAAASGTAVYAKLSETGYISRCYPTAYTPSATWTTPVGGSSYTYTGSTKGLRFPLEFHVYDELGNALDLDTIDGTYVVTLCQTGAICMTSYGLGAEGSDNIIYAQADSQNGIGGYVEGYVQANTGVDTQLTAIRPGSASPTAVVFSGGQSTNCNTGAFVATGSTVTCSGLDFNVKISQGDAENELGTALDLNGETGERITFYDGASQVACRANDPNVLFVNENGYDSTTDAYYYALPDTLGNTVYAKMWKPGYVPECDSTTIDPANTAVSNPVFTAAADELDYAAVVSVFNEELGNDLGTAGVDIIDGAGLEDLILYDDVTCSTVSSTKTVDISYSAAGGSGAGVEGYYIAASTGSFYMSFYEPGYVKVCSGQDGAGGSEQLDLTALQQAGGSQTVTAFSAADKGAIKYNVKISSATSDIYDMASQTVAISGGAGESFKLYNDSSCTTEATYVIQGDTGLNTAAVQDTTEYYLALAPGSYYAEFAPATALGLMTRCSSVAVSPAGTAQVLPKFHLTTSGGDNRLNLPYYVYVKDELGNAITDLTGNDILLGGNTKRYGAGFGLAVSNLIMFYNDGGAANLSGGLDGFLDIDSVGGNTEILGGGFIQPGTATPTVITLSGTTDCSDDTSTAAGDTETCAGLYYNTKISQGDVENELALAVNLNGSDRESVQFHTDGSGCAAQVNPELLSANGALNGYDSGTDAYYYALPEGLTYEVLFADNGYVSACASTGANDITPAAAAAAPQSPTLTQAGGDFMNYALKVTTFQDELGNALGIDNASGEALTLWANSSCTTATTTIDLRYNGGAWYIAADPDTHYLKAYEPGYVPVCEGNANMIADLSTQRTVGFTGAGGAAAIDLSRFAYAVALDENMVVTENGTAVTPDNDDTPLYGDEDFALYTTADCSTTEATYYTSGGGGADAYNNGTTWYAAVAPGNYYVKFTEPGLVPRCHSVQLNYSGTAQATATFDTYANSLLYPVHMIISDELGNAINLTGSTGDIAIANMTKIGVATHTTNMIYFSQSAAGLTGAVSGGIEGWLDINSAATDTMLGAVTFGTASSTSVILSGGDGNACIGASVADGADQTCSGLDFNTKFTAANITNELGNSTGISLGDGSLNENVALSTDNACAAGTFNTAGIVVSNATFYGYDSGTYYWPVQEDTDYYLYVYESGFLANCDNDGINKASAADKTTAEVPDLTDAGDTLIFAMKFANTGVKDELNNALTTMLDGDETFGVYTDSGCTTTATATGKLFASSRSGNDYYFALATQQYYIKYEEPGYVAECQSSANTNVNDLSLAGTQFTPALDNADLNGLKYNIKVNLAQDELGNGLTIDGTGSEDLAIYYNPTCTIEASTEYRPEAAGKTEDALYTGNAWYIAAASTMTYYVKYSETGYISECHPGSGAGITPDGTTQQIVNFVPASSTTGLRFPLRLDVYDELGNAIDVEAIYNGGAGGDVTLTHAKISGTPIYSDNIIYLAATESAAITGGVEGFVDINNAVAEGQYAGVAPGTASPTQIIMTGTNQCDTGATVAAEAIVSCRGLTYNVKIAQNDITTELGGTDYIELDGGATETITIHDDVADCLNSTNSATALAFATSAYNAYSSANDAYYFALKGGTTYSLKVSEPGYVDACSDLLTIVAHETATDTITTFNRSVEEAGAVTGLPYAIKVLDAETEADQAIDVDGAATETLELYTNADCSTAADGIVTYNGNTYYVAATNTVYMLYDEPGYIKKCAASSITPSSTAQADACYSDGAAGEPAACAAVPNAIGQLKYPLKVILATETGQQILDINGNKLDPDDLDVLKFDGVDDTYNNATDTAYWAGEGAGVLDIQETGYVDLVNSNYNSTGPIAGGLSALTIGNSSQTVITLGNSAACSNATYDGSGAAGLAQSCMGLQYQLKVTIADRFSGTTNDDTTYDMVFDDEDMTAAFCGKAITYAAADSNVGYWAGDGVGGCKLEVFQTGYESSNITNTGLDSFSVNDFAQTSIVMGENAALAAVTVPAAAGTPETNNVMGMNPGIKALVYDEYGVALDSNATASLAVNHKLMHAADDSGGTLSATYDNGATGDGTVDNIFYIAPSANASMTVTTGGNGYIANITSESFPNDGLAADTDVATITPAMVASGQVTIEFTGTTLGGASACDSGTVSAGDTIQCKGLYYNTIVKVVDDGNATPSLANAIAGLGNTQNFYFYNSGLTRLENSGTGLYAFKEVGSGVYKFALDSTSSPLSLKVKNVDYDADLNVDMMDSATSTLTLTGSEYCANVGTTDGIARSSNCSTNGYDEIQMFKKADHVRINKGVTTAPETQAGAGTTPDTRATVTVTLYTDNEAWLNAAVVGDGTGGSPNSPDAGATFTVEITGGAGGDSSTRSIVGADGCSNTITFGEAGSGSEVHSIDCVPTGASATIFVSDTTPTGSAAGQKIRVTVTKTNGSFPNDAGVSGFPNEQGQNVGYNEILVTVTPSALHHFDVTCGGVSQQMGVAFTSDCTVTAEDILNNTVTSYNNNVTLDLTVDNFATGTLKNDAGTITELSAAAFTNGVANLSNDVDGAGAGTSGLIYEGLANVVGTIRFIDTTDVTASGTVSIYMKHGAHAGYDVDCPSTTIYNAEAVTGSCSVRAIDSASNTILIFSTSTVTTELSLDGGRVVSGGDAGGGTSLTDDNFTSGEVSLTTAGMIFTGASGTAVLTAADSSTPSIAGSDTITIESGALNSFTVNCTGNITNNTKIDECSITPLDLSGNTITNFNNDSILDYDSTVTLGTSQGMLTDQAGGTTASNTIDNNSFTTGGATTSIGFYYVGAEGSVTLTATADDGTGTAGSDNSNSTGNFAMTVTEGAMDHFAVTCGGVHQTVGSALTSDCTITAQDISNNTYASADVDLPSCITLYTNISGASSTTGLTSAMTGGCANGSLSKDDFVNGVATLDSGNANVAYSGTIGGTAGSAGYGDGILSAYATDTPSITGQTSLHMVPGPLAAYTWDCAGPLTNRQVFSSCNLTAKDAQGNAIPQFATSTINTTISFTTPGTALGGTITGGDNGAGIIFDDSFTSGGSGTAHLDILPGGGSGVMYTDTSNSINSASGVTTTLKAESSAGGIVATTSVTMLPGALNDFAVACTGTEFRVRVPFATSPVFNANYTPTTCSVTARDADGNAIPYETTYTTNDDDCVEISFTAGTILGGSTANGCEADEIAYSEFTNGVATLDRFKYQGAVFTDRALVATKVGGSASGTTGTTAATLDMKPGALNSYTVSCGDQRVGVNFAGTCNVSVFDEDSNALTDFDTPFGANVFYSTPTAITLRTAEGDLTAYDLTTTVDNEDFSAGVLDVTSLGVSYTGASGTGALYADDGTKSGSGTINIGPGQLGGLIVDCYGPQTNGAAVSSCTITAKDTASNTINDFNTYSLYAGITTTMSLSDELSAINITGGSGAGDQIDRTVFSNGVADLNGVPITLTGVFSGTSPFTGTLTTTASNGATGTQIIEMVAGPISSFDVSCTDTDFRNRTNFSANTCTVTAKDASGNDQHYEDNYTTIPTDCITVSVGGGTIAGGGSDGCSASQIGPSDFTDGITNLDSFFYNGSTIATGTLTVTRQGGSNESGSVANINMKPGKLNSFDVSCGEQRVGVAFSGSCDITARDADSNALTDFSSAFYSTPTSVTLSMASGTLQSTNITLLGRADFGTTGIYDVTGAGFSYSGPTDEAGTGRLIAEADSTPQIVASGSLVVKAGALDSYTVDCDTQSHTNGAIVSAPCLVTALDSETNTITDFDSHTLYAAISTTLSLDGELATVDISGGSGPGGDQLDRTAFSTGTANLASQSIKLTGTFSGTSPFTGNLIATSSTAKTGQQTITMVDGDIDKFAVTCSGDAQRVGEELLSGDCTVTAKDQSNNTLLTFDADYTGQCVDIGFDSLPGSATGTNGVCGGGIQADNFTNGTVDLNGTGLSYQGATGTTILSATLSGSPSTAGTSTTSFSMLAGAVANATISCDQQMNNAAFSGSCKVTLMDGSSNRISDFTNAFYTDQTGVDISIADAVFATSTLTGDTTLENSDFDVYGRADIAAEGMTFQGAAATGSIVATYGSVTGAASMSVRPGMLEGYSLTCNNVPQVNDAPLTSDCTVTAKDFSSNTITDFGTNDTYYSGITTTISTDGELAAGDISGGSGGGGDQILRNSGANFVNGVANLGNLGFEYNGTLSGTAPFLGNLIATSSTGKDGDVQIEMLPGSLASFDVTCSTTDQRNREYLAAGCDVTAYDTDSNTITNYDTAFATHCVDITISGTATSTVVVNNSSTGDCGSSQIDAEDFTNGVADLNALQAQLQGTTGTGATLNANFNSGAAVGSTSINILPGQLAAFDVDCNSATQTVNVALTGTCDATALDADSNTISSYESDGFYAANTITVGTTADGDLDVSVFGTIDKTNFTSGVADLTAASLASTYQGTNGTGVLQLVSGSPVFTSTGTIRFRPGALDDYVWDCDSDTPGVDTQTNDTTFTNCAITVVDMADNVITDFDSYGLYTGATTTITADGDLSGATIERTSGGSSIFTADFTNGIADLNSMGFKIYGTFADADSDGLYEGDLIATLDTNGSITEATAIAVQPGQLDYFTLSCTDQQNDVPFTGTCTITAYDENDNIITTFSDATTLSTGGTIGSGTITGANLTGAEFASGVVSLVTEGIKYTGPTGSGTLIATSGSVTATTTLTVDPGYLTSYDVSCGTGYRNAVAFDSSCTVTAMDTSGNTITDFSTGTVVTTISAGGNLSSGTISGAGTVDGTTDDQIAASQFASGVVDLMTIGVMYTGEAQTGTIIATSDATTGNKTGQDNTTIVPGPLAKFLVDVQGANEVAVGTDKNFIIYATDISGNVLTDATETITITAAGTSASGTVTFTADGSANGTLTDNGDGTATYEYAAADQGSVTLAISSETPDDIDIDILETVDGYTDDEGDAGNDDQISFTPGAISSFVITTDNAAVAGATETITITAKDGFGNTKDNYTATATISFATGTLTASNTSWALGTGATGTLNVNTSGAAEYTFADADDGVVNIDFSHTVAGNINIKVAAGTVTDDDSEGDIVVSAADAAAFTLALQSTSVSAGDPATATIIVIDAYGNTATDYTDTVTLSHTGRATATTYAAVSAAGTIASGSDQYTFQAGDSGVMSFSVSYIVAEDITLNVTDGTIEDDNSHSALTVTVNTSDTVLATTLPTVFDVNNPDVTASTGVSAGTNYSYDDCIDTGTAACTYTGQWDTYTYTDDNGGTSVTLQYPTTDSSTSTNIDIDMQIPADFEQGSSDYSQAQVQVTLVDQYGNPLSGLQLQIVGSLVSATRIASKISEADGRSALALDYNNQQSIFTDASGQGLFSVASDTPGDYEFTIYFVDGNGNLIPLKTFRMTFAATDATAPQVDLSASSGLTGDGIASVASLAANDMFALNQEIMFTFSWDDTPDPTSNENESSGFDTSAFRLAVIPPGSTEQNLVTGTVDQATYNGTTCTTSQCTTQTSVCTFATTTVNIGSGACKVYTNSTSGYFNNPGFYTFKLYVYDNAGQSDVVTVTLRITSSMQFGDIHTLPNPFYPSATNKYVRITFQASQSGSVSAEIYNSVGRLVWTTTQAVDAGYNEIFWQGTDMGGNMLANGIYFYRLTGNFAGGSAEGKGKIAIIKR